MTKNQHVMTASSIDDELFSGSSSAASASVVVAVGQEQQVPLEVPSGRTHLWARGPTTDNDLNAVASSPEKFQLASREDALVVKPTAFLVAYFERVQSSPNRLHTRSTMGSEHHLASAVHRPFYGTANQ